MPKSQTSTSLADGRFEKQNFIYHAEDNEYRCPAGERLIHRFTAVEDGKAVNIYWSSACPRCPIRARCITATSRQRRVRRWEHEAVLDEMQRRLDQQPESMRVRRRTVEHPFGTLKYWMGATHFLMKTLSHVRTEMSRHVLAYKFKRVMKILGLDGMLQAIRA